MNTTQELQKRLADLRQEYKGVLSMLAMMEKATKREDILKMEREKLDPIRKEIQAVEEALSTLMGPK